MDANSDVLIVGGGMVGASLAHALSMLGLQVAVVEASAPRAPAQASYDERSTALAWASRRIFEGLGLWRQLRTGATPIHEIHVSDRGRFGVTRLARSDAGVEALGYVVENRTLGRVLWQRLEAGPVQLYCPARITAVGLGDDAVELTLATDSGAIRFRTRLLVVADGARSATRDLLGIGAEVTDYAQSAVIANVTPARPHSHVAYERFTPSGPLAMLPMSNGRCSLVWTQSPEAAAAIMRSDEPGFLAALQDAFGYRLGRLQRAGTRHCYPLALVQAERVTGTRHAVIGNAAHGLHPVAGQGFNLGLRDVATLAEVIADAGTGADPGAGALLRRYAQWRRDDQRHVVGFTDGLIRVFGSAAAPVRLARSAGLVALDLFSGPRSMFARQSMGLGGRVPRLARGVPLR